MGRIYNPDDFIMQYPGVYHGAAKEAMEKYFAMIEEINSTEVTGADIVAGTIPAVKLGATLTLSGEFDTVKDKGMYEGLNDTMLIREGYCYVVYPEDAHAPGKHLEAANDLTKIVVKLKV